MHHARSTSPLGRKVRGIVLAGGLCLSGWGCQHHHHYYYGSSANCPPGSTVPATVMGGPICDTSSDVGQPASSSTSQRPNIVEGGRQSKVIVSVPSSSSKNSRFSWRSSDNEPEAITQSVDGALSDSTVK